MCLCYMQMLHYFLEGTWAFTDCDAHMGTPADAEEWLSSPLKGCGAVSISASTKDHTRTKESKTYLSTK